MDIIIVELAKAIQDGQLLIDDVPEIFKEKCMGLIESEETEEET